jgi:hypothetical protein
VVATAGAEPPLYRAYALVAFGAALLAGLPVGWWLLAWLYLGAPAVPVEWRLLHAHVLVYGFFGTLIAGVAQHLCPRFTGRPVSWHPASPLFAAVLAVALLWRVFGAVAGLGVMLFAVAVVQAAAFGLFAAWVWRTLDPPPLALLRRHLTISTAWLASGCVLEAALRGRVLAEGGTAPDLGAMRAVHAMGILGGILGWVIGVLLRAGPMFVPAWHVPSPVARGLTAAVGVGVALAVLGDSGGWPGVVARAGDALVLSAVAAALLLGGAMRRVRGGLPMLARSPEESRIFRLAAVSLVAAAAGSLVTVAMAATGAPVHVLVDAVRHLVTVGFLTSVVVAMTFRLVPALERRALPWPGLRTAAFWALVVAVVARTGEVAVAYVAPRAAPVVAVSGFFAWAAVAAVGANLVGAITGREPPAP